jgi:hypothetical protein
MEADRLFGALIGAYTLVGALRFHEAVASLFPLVGIPVVGAPVESPDGWTGPNLIPRRNNFGDTLPMSNVGDAESPWTDTRARTPLVRTRSGISLPPVEPTCRLADA